LFGFLSVAGGLGKGFRWRGRRDVLACPASLSGPEIFDRFDHLPDGPQLGFDEGG
jgi:hypothetical protein